MRNVKIINGIPATKSSFGSHYGERIFDFGEEKFREWIPWRSKLSAVILKGYEIDFKGNEKILYLGAASGTTVSHLADIVDKGVIYAIEFSAKPFMKLLELSRERDNIIPILSDASKPWEYSGVVEKVDFIYEDIAQKNQIEILELNSEFFLKDGGEFMIMVKARSIDSTIDAKEIFPFVLRKISKKFSILGKGELEPYHRDHIFIHGIKK